MNSLANPGRVAPDRPSVRRSGLIVVVLVSAVLAGCASFSPDAGFSSIESAAKDKLGKDVRWARSDADVDTIDRRVRELLAKPLSVDDAVQVALLNNRGLQARFQDLGITEAEVVQAGRLPNPGFTFGRLRRGDEVELERGLHLNLARLLTLPMVSQLEARRFEQVKREVTMDVLSLAADARKAYFQAVAAEETVRYMRQVKQTAEASAELARRMEQVGNFSKLARAREQAFYADAALGFARADQAQRASRERLARLLGEEISHRFVAAGQDASAVLDAHRLHRAEQQFLGFGHGSLGGAVHGGHQFIDTLALARGLQQLGAILQEAGQRNLDFWIAQEPIGLAEQRNSGLGAALECGADAGRGIGIAQHRSGVGRRGDSNAAKADARQQTAGETSALHG
jgi:hypothetical protein